MKEIVLWGTRISLAAALLIGCNNVGELDEPEGDAGTDTDTDTDSDADVIPDNCDKGTFMGNYSLTSQLALDALEGYTGVTGDLEVYMAPSLTSLQGLECLETIGGELRVEFNESLESLDGLDNVETIGSFLDVAGNDALVSVDLAKLASVGGMLYIVQNPSFVTLDLSSLTYVGDAFVIRENETFTCDPDTLVEGIEIVGDVEIHNNAPDGGCGPNDSDTDADTVMENVRYFNPRP